ncbi:MAG: HD domain-containing protein [Deltaproteobacteria bacterium]|nr:HD domain-containing protein [Deltaproteobacteria bacterium]
MTEGKSKDGGAFITQFTAAIQNAGMYPPDHPKVRADMEGGFHQLEELLMEKQQINIVMIGKSIMVDNRPLIITSTYKAAFLRILNKTGLERITLKRGLPFAEFAEFIRSLGESGMAVLHSTPYIILGRLELIKGKESPEEEAAAENAGWDVEEIHDAGSQSPADFLEGLYRDIVEKKIIDFDAVNGLVVQFIASISRETNPLRLLSQIKSMDEYTFVHTVNVGILTMSLAQYVGFGGPDLNKIGTAAILHDVGKITIPHDILSKQGALTPEERHVIENHTINGAMHLLALGNISPLAVLTAMEHHIKYDGTGYPQTKKPWETNIVSQMTTIADVFDALYTKRPYRNPLPITEIARIMKEESGATFNPYLLERFFNMLERS